MQYYRETLISHMPLLSGIESLIYKAGMGVRGKRKRRADVTMTWQRLHKSIAEQVYTIIGVTN